MIKSIPGWANYVILAAVYFGASLGLTYLGDALFGFPRPAGVRTFLGLPAYAVGLSVIYSLFHAGAYLAKWRFFGTDLRFY